MESYIFHSLWWLEDKKKEKHHITMPWSPPNFLFPPTSRRAQKNKSLSLFLFHSSLWLKLEQASRNGVISLPFSMTTRGPKKKKDIAMPRSSPTADDKKDSFSVSGFSCLKNWANREDSNRDWDCETYGNVNNKIILYTFFVRHCPNSILL